MARAAKAAKTPATAAGVVELPSKDELLNFYREMLLIRRFEERAGQLYGMGLIGGFCHLYIGQEAIAVGMQSIMKPGDQVITGPYNSVRGMTDGDLVKVDNAKKAR